MSIKLLDTSQVTYNDHVLPIVEIPFDLKKRLSETDQQSLRSACLRDYREAMKCLNESVADVASQDKKALAFAFKLAKRVLNMMEIVADLGLDERSPATLIDDATLIGRGVPENAIRARSFHLLRELKRGNLKAAVVGESGQTEAGYIGMSPLAINNAIKGNLREMLYISYKTTRAFTDKLLAKSENVNKINMELNKRDCGWQINADVIQALKKQLSGDSLYQYGAYAASRDSGDGSRTTRDKTYRTQYQERNPTIKEMQQGRIPLSRRELLAQSSDLDPEITKKVLWLPGEAWCGVKENSDGHPSLKAANETGAVMLTGISGTTDLILTMGHFLGMFDGDDKEKTMRDGMVACMGWMIDAKDHTVHEIQMSAKSFGLDYTPGATAYKQIRPGDNQFENELRAAQKKRGYDMPDEMLKGDHVCKKANELFPDLFRKQTMLSMKAVVDTLRPVRTDNESSEDQEFDPHGPEF